MLQQVMLTRAEHATGLVFLDDPRTAVERIDLAV